MVPRLLITAGKSGAGKTVITCGILSALKKRGLKLAAYKCGPDYIDPMFHREVLKIPGYNLDTFLCGRENVRELLRRHSGPGRMAVIEGVMGYYDGLGGASVEASTFDVADATGTPAILIVDCKGASVSVIPHIQGFLRYREERSENSHIAGVVLNRVSPMLYGRMKMLIEREASVRVYGYVPETEEAALESRYLGLKLPGEIERLREKLGRLGDIMEETLDLDGMLETAAAAKPLHPAKGQPRPWEGHSFEKCVRIGVAMDEAFCFIYEDNLDILERLGAKIVPFSPVHDRKLPGGLDGMAFYGGYPELFGRELCENLGMRKQVRQAALAGLPCIAECGGFMYLTEGIRDKDWALWPMCGVLEGESFYTPKLQRFGYAVLRGGKVFGREAGEIFAHEFHYYDSGQCGEAFEAKKPLSDRTWRCMASTDSILAGYPHIHYAGSPKVAEGFVEACRDYSRRKPGD